MTWRWGGSIDYTARYGFTVNAAIVAAVILWIRAYPTSPAARLLAIAPLAWIGRMSYSIYLWHRVAFDAGSRLSRRLVGFAVDAVPAGAGPAARAGALSLWIACLVLVPAASYYLIEKPFLRLKERIGSPAEVK